MNEFRTGLNRGLGGSVASLRIGPRDGSDAIEELGAEEASDPIEKDVFIRSHEDETDMEKNIAFGAMVEAIKENEDEESLISNGSNTQEVNDGMEEREYEQYVLQLHADESNIEDQIPSEKELKRENGYEGEGEDSDEIRDDSEGLVRASGGVTHPKGSSNWW